MKTSGGSLTLDFNRLAVAVREASSDIVFAVVLGSAKGGVVEPGSDLDLAVFLTDPERAISVYDAVSRAVNALLPEVIADIGFLNRADPVYRFQAASGRLLFTRDQEVWLDFFSRAAREYEYQIADYARQLRYRLEARHARERRHSAQAGADG